VMLDENQEARAVALEAMLFLHSAGVWDYEYRGGPQKLDSGLGVNSGLN